MLLIVLRHQDYNTFDCFIDNDSIIARRKIFLKIILFKSFE